MPVQIADRFDIQGILQTTAGEPVGFAKNIFLLDTDEVPVDRRVLEVTQSDFADLLDSNGLPYAYAATHFSQKRTPESLLIGRWAKTASETYTNMGSDYVKVLADWVAVTDGTFTVFEAGTPATFDEITAVTFAGATSLDQIPGILTDAIQAVATPNVTGLDTAVFSFDVFNRLVLTMPATGEAAATVDVKALAIPAGTDLAVLFLDSSNTVIVPGLDSETITDAIQITNDIDNTGYFVTAKFDDDKATKATEILAFAAKIESMTKLGVVMADDADIIDSSKTADIFSQLQTLGYKRTLGLYYESIALRSTTFPDSAGLAAVMPAAEGTTKFCQEALAGVTASGYIADLSSGATNIVRGKGGNVVEHVGGVMYWFDGLTFGGEQLRTLLGRHWFTTTIGHRVQS